MTIDFNNKEMIRMSETPVPYEKRYGNIAIENGFITPKQLIEALNIRTYSRGKCSAVTIWNHE